MGNRAVITTKEALKFGEVQNSDILGVYLHWNGGRDSVEAFLKYCELQGFRSPDTDCYGWARLCQVIANFFGASGLSVGINKCCNLDCDNGDNGTYIIEGWEIVDRKYFDDWEQDEYDLNEMLKEINKAQPLDQQIPEEYFDAEEVDTLDLERGDVVFVKDRIDGTIGKYTVVGLCGDKNDFLYVPFVDKYIGVDGNYSTNRNNYLREPSYRRVKKSN